MFPGRPTSQRSVFDGENALTRRLPTSKRFAIENRFLVFAVSLRFCLRAFAGREQNDDRKAEENFSNGQHKITPI